MGLFSNNQKELIWNFHIRDDHKFIFRKLEMDSGWAIEKDANGKEIAAFMVPYGLLKHFDGYGKIPACNLLVTYPRDVLWDSFNDIPTSQKPEKGKGIRQSYMSGVADATIYKNAQTAKPGSTTDKIVIFLGSVIIILALSIGLQFVMRRAG